MKATNVLAKVVGGFLRFTEFSLNVPEVSLCGLSSRRHIQHLKKGGLSGTVVPKSAVDIPEIIQSLNIR